MNKFKFLLFLLTSISLNSYTQTLENQISISLNNVKIKAVLNQIESKTKLKFSHGEISNLENKVTIAYQNEKIETILKEVLNKNGIGFEAVGYNVALYELKEKVKKKKITFSGYIYDAVSGEALIGCKIFEPTHKIGAVTNNFGFFSISLDEGAYSFSVSYIGYTKQLVEIDESKVLTIKLNPKENTLSTVVVDAEKVEERIESSDMGKIKLTSEEINAIPAIGGEVDVLKSITLLPGIKQGVDGSSGFYVRGGGPDQNLILLDGVPLYNPYHMWGFLSTFNAEAINNIEVTKGAFPARYGGRLSSVLDITMKEGNNREWSSSVTLGLLSAKASVSGPVVKDKSSIMLSARRTYIDLIIVPILKRNYEKDGIDVKEGYNFTDLNLKYNYRFSDKDRIYFSGFFSKDKYYFDSFSESLIQGGSVTTSENIARKQGWGNIITSIRWNHLFGSKLFVNTSAYYTSYNYFTNSLFKSTSTNTGIAPEKENTVSYTSTIRDLALKQDYQFFISKKQTLRFGLSGIVHDFEPGVNAYKSETDQITINNKIENNDIQGTELSLYVEDDFDLSRRIKINAGLHGSGFLVQNSTYYSLQPRLSARFLVGEHFSLKAGYSNMTQYLHLLTSSGITQSSDLWVPSTDKIKPQQSHQVSVSGTVLLGDKYSLEVEGYYKTMSNLIDYKDGVTFLTTATGWEDRVAVGKGDAYGGEIFLKKNKGKITGWLGYTLSWTNRQFEEINFGEIYPYRYDRRHDISLVGNYKLSDKWTLNGAWVLYTGNAVTIPTAAYIAPGYDGNFQGNNSFPSPGVLENGNALSSTGIVENPQGRNNYRLPNYHRLDLTAVRNVKRAKSEHTLTVGLTNIYNRLNPSFYYVAHEQNAVTGVSRVIYKTRTLFPIMPTISYNIKF